MQIQLINDIARVIDQFEKKGIRFSCAADSLSFSAPKGTLSEFEKEDLKKRRKEIIRYLSARNASRLLDIPPSDLTAQLPYQPSSSQELWWRAYGGADEGKPFPMNINVTTLFDAHTVDNIERALRHVVEENTALRSRFSEDNGRLTVCLNSPETLKVDIADLSAFDFFSSSNRLTRDLHTFFSEFIPILNSWLIKAKFFVFAGGKVFMALSINHIVFDGFSKRLLLNALNARLKDDVPLSYSTIFFDYSRYERTTLEDVEGRHLQSYWKDWTRSLPIRSACDGGRSLAWAPGVRVARTFFLPPIVSRHIRRHARAVRTTAFVVHLTIFSMALSIWGGWQRVAVRGLGNKRSTPELSSAIGLLYCADSFDISIVNAADFHRCLEGVHASYLEALALRLPTIQFFAPFVALAIDYEANSLNPIPATINFLSEIEFPDEAPQGTINWPPSISHEEPQVWSRPISPIFLHLHETDRGTKVSVQFNQKIILSEEQDKFFNCFLDIFYFNGFLNTIE